MNISATPVEAYRQTNDQLVKKETGIKNDNIESQKAERSEKVAIPGRKNADTLALKLEKSPSLLSQVLSSDEKDLLVKYFARFGDEAPDSQVYNTDARTKAAPLTGIRVDVRG